MSGKRWRFVNSQNHAQIIVEDPVSAAVLHDLLTKHHPEWKLTSATAAQAAPVAPSAPETSTPTAQTAAPSSAPPAHKPTLVAVETPAPSQATERKAGQERRRHPRYNLRFRVILTVGAASFRSYTRDVSLGGMQLENKVPASFLGKPCKVFVSSPTSSENIELSCCVLTDDPVNPLRVKFDEASPQSIESLQIFGSWIDALNRSTEKAAA